jgi:hypothetical protein
VLFGWLNRDGELTERGIRTTRTFLTSWSCVDRVLCWCLFLRISKIHINILSRTLILNAAQYRRRHPKGEILPAYHLPGDCRGQCRLHADLQGLPPVAPFISALLIPVGEANFIRIAHVEPRREQGQYIGKSAEVSGVRVGFVSKKEHPALF